MFKIKWRLRDIRNNRISFYFKESVSSFGNENLARLQMFKFKTIFPFNVYYLEKI